MRRVALGVAVVVAALVGGCGGDDGPTEPQNTGYPERSTPQNLLMALTMSYEAGDSVETKQLYDSSYVGTSTDLNDPPGSQTRTFTYADEVAHVAALARTPSISNVVMDLGPSSSWTRLPSDDPSHPEWALIQIGAGNWRVEIYDGQTLYSAQSTNPMTFAFKPTVAAPPDTTWRIVRWTEVGSGIP